MSQLPVTYVEGFHNIENVRKMKYLPLGETNLKVSKLSIGGATLAPFFGDVDEQDAIRTIQKAIKNGVNYIDTAPYYGQGKSERIIGEALKGIPREAYYIATKVGRYEIDLSKQFDYTVKKTRESVTKSLGLLGIDYVDVIQIHDVEFAENLDVVINEALPTCHELVKEGKARFIGVTGYPLNVLKEAILRAPGKFDLVLAYSRYTLLDDSLISYIPFFQENKLGIICAAGHALGLLTNNGPQPWHPAHEDTKEMSRKAAEICKENGIELGKLAAYYFSQLNGPATFLIGMQSEKLLDINFDAVVNGLNAKEEQILDDLLKNVFTKKTHWEGVELKKMFNR